MASHDSIDAMVKYVCYLLQTGDILRMYDVYILLNLLQGAKNNESVSLAQEHQQWRGDVEDALWFLILRMDEASLRILKNDSRIAALLTGF